MRRPVKPFVTEYKTAPRRQTSPSGAHQPFLNENEPPPAKPGEFVRLDPNTRSEDSYEAALRAADALFSGSREKSAAAPAAKPAPQSEALAETVSAAHVPVPERGGRILRVIDEPPSPALVALEVERAPKRRGRKPGSKNKPKPPMEPAAINVQATVPVLVAARSHETPMDHTPVSTVQAMPPVWMNATPTTIVTRKRGGERFAWVRKTLGPGERWKRHMPKVCW